MIIVPPDLTFPREKIVTARQVAAMVAAVSSRCRAVVQAGGCSGIWALALSRYFDRVYTFEPAPTNFRCLQMNIAGRPRITAFPYALGALAASVGLTRPKAQAGLWRVDGPGEIPMVALDDLLGDVAVDAIVLDIEGSEVCAFRGAERLIAAHRPLLWFEYLNHRTEIEGFLAAHGYAPPTPGIGGDAYSVYAA